MRRRNWISIPVWCDWRYRKIIYSTGVEVFQFQYGAIEGCDAVDGALQLDVFQFQYGAIEGADTFYCPQCGELQFQFQYGAIEGCRVANIITGDANVFQFQYGAIEGTALGWPRATFSISIPVWCDWRSTPSTWLTLSSNFNSSMVRLKERKLEVECCNIAISIPVWCDWRRFRAWLFPLW